MFRSQNKSNKFMSSSKLPVLPVLVAQRAFEFLGETDLKSCRQTCRTWNWIIISSGFLPVVDFYFDFKTLFSSPSLRSSLVSLPFITKNFRRAKLQLKTLQNLISLYIQNQRYACTSPTLKLKLVGIERFPKFIQAISPEFSHVLNNVTCAEIQQEDSSSISKLTAYEIAMLMGHMPSLKRLTIPSQLLTLLKPEVISTNAYLILCFASLTHLHIEFSDDLEVKADEFKNIGELFSSIYLPELRTVGVKCPKQLLDKNGLGLEGQIGRFSSILHENIGYLVQSKLKLYNLYVDIEGLPLTIFNHTGILMLILFISMRGLTYLSLKLVGETLPASVATTMESVVKSGCKVDLSMKLIYNDMTGHLRNNLVISLPEVHRHIQKMILCFTSKFERSTAGSVYCLRHFFPKHVNLDENLGRVVYENLTSLRIDFETGITRLFLDFSNLASSCPNVKEISCIEGPEERYQSKWHMWTGGGGKLDGLEMICCWHFRWILESFPKLESLVLWARMDEISDAVFVWDYRNTISLVDCNDNQHICIADLAPKLRKLSLRGLGRKVTDKALESLHRLRHLTHLELIGRHKISSTGRKKLMQRISTLQQFTIHL